MTQAVALRVIRLLHTAVWALFAASIVLIPILAHVGRFAGAAMLIALVLVEVAILVANRMRCLLTDVAAHYTSDRRDNFDIYLPLWVARYNKQLFGTLYVLGVVYTLGRWAGLGA
jgi:hypothetical protein